MKDVAYLWSLSGICGSGTCMAIIYQVNVAVGYDVAHICTNVGSMYPYRMRAV